MTARLTKERGLPVDALTRGCGQRAMGVGGGHSGDRRRRSCDDRGGMH